MNTSIVYVKMKSQWPLGNRELLLLFQGHKFPDGRAYIAGKSTEHPDFPENPKCYRVNTTVGSYYFEPINHGKGTKLIYITEFDFKGSIPRYVLNKAAPQTFVDGLLKLKKMIAKQES